ncbi:uncharacterized protein FPRO_15952 [Fusarium proliferatum ET1]|uniref:Uncharacterized protein n=1 Tax=Fusarium proliferatum (strain ET1) TaxID=1227346 RepID=A0A1L7WAD8_FUSPR|nr:uncharacterized protein FPRO_15952 [Fusarium proliferatum ET1]CZR49594.1 uncharacterized protein FPRO_15952 [Fusarium proliferatum ET1]
MQDFGKDTAKIEDASAWVSLNTFTGRITNNGLVDFSLYAIIEIPKALEKEIPPSGPTRDFKLRTANNWILAGGVKLFKDARKADTLDEGGGGCLGYEATQVACRMEKIMEDNGQPEARRLGTTEEDGRAEEKMILDVGINYEE